MADNQNLPAAAGAQSPGLPAGFGTTILALDDPASTSATQAKAGAALADVVKQVGMAVADTQKRLNEIAASTATSLANTQVDVIAARAKVYDQTGTLTDEYNLTMKLPLVNFIDPVNYEVSRVRIQGMFSASEVRGESSTGIQTSVTNSGGGGLILGAPIFGYGYGQSSSTDTETGGTYHADQAYGFVRMNAEIRPRADIGVPRPNQLIHGPSLLLVPQEVQQRHQDADANKPVIARTVIVKLSYRRRADAANPTGKPINDQTFSIETPGLVWSFCDALGRDENHAFYVGKPVDVADLRRTTGNGELYVLIRRDFPLPAGDAAAPSDTSQRPFTVAARIGMVQSTVAVSL